MPGAQKQRSVRGRYGRATGTTFAPFSFASIRHKHRVAFQVCPWPLSLGRLQSNLCFWRLQRNLCPLRISKGPLQGRYGHNLCSSLSKARGATGEPSKGARAQPFLVAFHRQPLLVAMQRTGTRRGNLCLWLCKHRHKEGQKGSLARALRAQPCLLCPPLLLRSGHQLLADAKSKGSLSTFALAYKYRPSHKQGRQPLLVATCACDLATQRQKCNAKAQGGATFAFGVC
jgi:hypothetical protein